MNASKRPPTKSDIIIADGEELNLRNRYLAAVLAWLVPGAGHFYQQRYLKSAIFFVCIVPTFVLGVFLSGGRCVYACWNSTEIRWQFVLQSGIGLPAIPAYYQYHRTKGSRHVDPLWGGALAGPRSEADLDAWNKETASGFDMGTLYTMVAGLLNVLVVFDAFAGPLPPPVAKPGSNKRKTPMGDSPPADEGEPGKVASVAESQEGSKGKNETSPRRKN